MPLSSRGKLHTDAAFLASGRRVEYEAQIFWPDELRHLHLTHLKLEAMYKKVQSFLGELTGEVVCLYCDVQAVVAMLSHFTSRNQELMRRRRCLWILLGLSGIALQGEHYVCRGRGTFTVGEGREEVAAARLRSGSTARFRDAGGSEHGGRRVRSGGRGGERGSAGQEDSNAVILGVGLVAMGWLDQRLTGFGGTTAEGRQCSYGEAQVAQRGLGGPILHFLAPEIPDECPERYWEAAGRVGGMVVGCSIIGGRAGRARSCGCGGWGCFQEGTWVEVSPSGKREWFGGRWGRGRVEEGAVVIEYFDGDPVRDEVFLEREPRNPGVHNGHLIRRDGGAEVTAEEVKRWSVSEERGLLVGWRLLDEGVYCTGWQADLWGRQEGGATGVDGPGAGEWWKGCEAWGGALRAWGEVAGGSGQAAGGAWVGEAALRAGSGIPRAEEQAQGQHGAAGLVGDPEGLGEEGWTWLQGLSVDECAVSDFPSLMVPKKVRGLFTECVMVALRRMRVDTADIEAYKLFFLLPRLVLQPVQQGVKQGVAQVPGDRRVVAEADEERVLRDAVRLVKAGQLGKAAKRLELAKLAPATEETLLKLERLHPAGTGRRRDVGEDRRRELREQALELDEKTFDDVMRNLPRASGPGSSQWRWEHLWAVHVSGGRDALLEVCNHLTAGRAPTGVREWLAGARLVVLLKDDLGVNVRPIACGEVLRKLVAKVICKQEARAFRARFCGPRQDDELGGLRAAQIGVAVKGGADLGVHTVQAALDRHPEWVCVKADARNAFNAVHREAMFEAIERDFPELWAWTDLCYGVEANLGFRLGGADDSAMRFVKSKEGTQQGDPLGPLYLAGPLQMVLERVQERHPGMVISAYLDDAFLMGPPNIVALAYGTYMEEVAAIGLDIQPVKSAAFSPEGDASCFEDGMPGARGELDFIDVLVVPVGKAEAVSAEMSKKVEDLCAILPILNKLGHAQAQGLLLRFCAHPRRMQEALRDLLPGGGLAWHSCEFATLPHGMGLTKAARVSSVDWLGGFAQVWEDMRQLFPTVTAGTEDLGAESDLPYVTSLQAAMRKVSEAVEVIEGARVANEHLPPQVPKADDVKKLSDYSRSQKRAQRVYAAVLHSADWLWLAGHVGASRLPWLFSVTYNSIGPAFLRGVPCCPALDLSSAEYRVALRHILHAEQPLLGQVEKCPDCGGERDPTGTHLLGCRGGAGAGGGNWYSFIHHKLQRVLFEVAKSAYPLASALHDDFAGHLTYSPNHCPDVTVLDAEGPGQHVLFDVATARPMSDAHLGAAMMAPGAAAKKVEKSKVATYGDVRPHHFIPFGVEVYGGLGPAAHGFLQKMQRCFRERRYMVENVERGEQVDGDGDEDRDEETTHDGTVGWKEKWIRQLSFALARGVAGLIIRRAVGRCPPGLGWRWAGGGHVREGMGPNPDGGGPAQREGVERLALMDRAWEGAIEEIGYATQDGSGGGTQGSGGTQDEQSEQASGGVDEAGAMASRLLESKE
ncbi:hypothetical protein CYMTET_47966 [Cymbomonas tetramitiformis]|uniref:Reverse transcriptase domain-containing protein n=1 Tax=Cymbomonas tetramitiformis TaxID=36881 RepID=A0AAE0EW74_9CHLO|nr:hypothetical protein CYMTET_47966 [Cymbomonas tetramitiformis]